MRRHGLTKLKDCNGQLLNRQQEGIDIYPMPAS